MKYPNTPEYLENAPNYLVSLYEEFEADVLRDLCRRLRLSGTVTESALNQIRVLQQQGQSFPYIEKRLRQLSGASQKEIDRMFEEAVERNAAYYKGVIDKAAITAPNPAWEQALQQQADAIRRQTQDELRNFTQSMGFAIRTGSQVKFYGIAEAYQKALDKAALEVASGAMDYNTAIRGAVRDLTGSGLQWVDYASGWHNRVDVAARRAVMTGITQLSAQYTNQAMEILDTRYVETTAHGGARDKGDDFRNHKKWQGKWYYWSLHGEPDPLGKYPDFVRETGYGDVAGLCGANCRHGYFAVVPGVNEPTYTAKQLRDIDPPPFEYQGKTYTAYEATQKQRQIETKMRELKRRLIGLEASGDNKAYEENAILLNRLSREYKAFSGAAGLRTQPERARVQGFGQKEAARARRGLSQKSDGKQTKPLKNAAGQRIIEVKKTDIHGEPNSITQKTGPKGGIDRNFYGEDGKQTLQISNNDHGFPKLHPFGAHGEHAHDYTWNAEGKPERSKARELTGQERRDNDDFL